MTTTHGTTRRALLAALFLLPAVGLAHPLTAQTPSATEACSEGRARGSLGITGLRCRDCSFETSNGAMLSARFGTEPEVLQTEGASALRRGDVLVAVGGHLITTRAGADALTSLRPGQDVTLRVRRDGQEREISARATARCVEPPPPAPDAPRPPLPPRTADEARATVAVGAPAAPLPPLAPPPALASMRPNAQLGFAFECSRCSYTTDEAAWSFQEYPTVFRVEPEGPARGLLQPGDEIRAVEGHDLRTPEGGRAFSEIRAGQEVRWTVRRNGETRTVRIQARAKEVMPRPDQAAVARAPSPGVAPTAAGSAGAAVAPMALVSSVLRYAGSLGDTRIEVVGEPVTVTRVGNELVIRTRGNEIRVVLGGGEGG